MRMVNINMTTSLISSWLFLSPIELKTLLCHNTGTAMVTHGNIIVSGTDAWAISAHTCANMIVFSRGSFVDDTSESFESFKVAMKSVITSPLQFNMA